MEDNSTIISIDAEGMPTMRGELVYVDSYILRAKVWIEYPYLCAVSDGSNAMDALNGAVTKLKKKLNNFLKVK